MTECPYCKSIKVKKNGKSRGTQRMLCTSCKRTFAQTPRRCSKEI